MSESKKNKRLSELEAALPEKSWATVVEVANDLRSELHKQAAAFITFAEGVATSGFALVTKLNHHVDELGQDGLRAVDHLGLQLLAKGRALPKKATESAREAAQRASESARVLVASPPAKAA